MNFPYGTNATTVGKKRLPKWLDDLLGIAIIVILIAIAVIVANAIIPYIFGATVRCEGANGGYHRHFWGRCL